MLFCESIFIYSSMEGRGGSYVAEHGNWPIFSTEFEKIVYILADFGK